MPSKISFIGGVFVAFFLLCLLLPTRSMAQPTATLVTNWEGTVTGIRGVVENPDAPFKIILPDGSTVSPPPDRNGHYYYQFPPGTKGPVKVQSGDSTTSVNVSSLNPPDTTTTTTASLVSTSTATLGSNTFALTGGFSALDTSVDYDPTSPTYGNVSGVVLASAFNITGNGPAGTLALSLSGDEAYTVNLASVWAEATTAISIDTDISGIATLNGVSTPFSGSLTGTDTFSDDGTDDIVFNFTANTQFGQISGPIEAMGYETLNVPEPNSIALLIGLGLSSAGFLARRKSTRQPA